MSAARYVFGAGAIGAAFALCALLIKHWHDGQPYAVTCRECGDTQVLKDGITADEFRKFHRTMHAAQRLNAEQRARRQNAGRN